MNFFKRSAYALLLSTCAASAQSHVFQFGTADDPARPMEFRLVRYLGSYEPHKVGDVTVQVMPSNDGHEHINAAGSITEDTADRFRAFLEENAIKYADIHFDSVGGNLAGALALGREIRRRGFRTEVNQLTDHYGILTKETYLPAQCESACVYAFLGGTVRRLLTDADYILATGFAPHPQQQIGLHQFRTNLAIADGPATRGAAGDLGGSAAQFTSGALIAYLEEMGANPDVVTLSNRAPISLTAGKPPVYYPTVEELVAAGILTSSELGEAMLTAEQGDLAIVARSTTPDMTFRQVSLYCSKRGDAASLRLVLTTMGYLSFTTAGPFDPPVKRIEASLTQPVSNSDELVDALFPWRLQAWVDGHPLVDGGSHSNGRRTSEKLDGYSLAHEAVSLPLAAARQIAGGQILSIRHVGSAGTPMESVRTLSLQLNAAVRGGIGLLERNCLGSS